MADFLTAVKSVRNENQNPTFKSDLTELNSTGKTHPNGEREASTPQPGSVDGAKSDHVKSISSPEDALQIIRSRPNLDQLVLVLKTLQNRTLDRSFEIHAPGPLQSQIINALLANVVPDFLPALDERNIAHLIGCLRSVAGCNAVIARLRLLSSRESSSQTAANQDLHGVTDMLKVTGQLFSGDDFVAQIFSNLQRSVSEKLKRDMVWKDFVNLIGSGKVITAVAQASDRVPASQQSKDFNKNGTTLASGPQYAAWLGRNLATMLSRPFDITDEEVCSATSNLLAKSLKLGYSNAILGGLFGQIIPEVASGSVNEDTILQMLKNLPSGSNRTFTEHLLRWCSSLLTSEETGSIARPQNGSKGVLAFSALISLVTKASKSFHESLLLLLSDSPFSSSVPFTVRRACLATVAKSSTASDDLQSLLERLMSTFHDIIFANHAPIIQQESFAQTLLLTAGYLHRQTPMELLMTARSSNHMQGVSNRLDSSNVKGRWLGMVVATAISSLVDKQGSKMSFGTDEMETEEAGWYRGLVQMDDSVGTIKDIEDLLQSQNRSSKPKRHSVKTKQIEQIPKLNGKPVFGPPRPPAQTEVIGEKVSEVVDSDDESQDDFKPYAKPDSDPEDSDEDATLVNRNKARPPVYIRDLMSMLRDDKNYDRFQLAMKHAAALIRRKSNFGAEVKDHAEEIGVILCNLQDPFAIEDLNELKLQTMIAVLLSDIKTMAPWFSRQAFLGEYSIAQRCAILSALGLGGRELAGLKQEDELNPTQSNTKFPSKRLPPHLHSIYNTDTSTTKRLEAASQEMEQALIKPMALQAADQSTSHLNAVKVRTFSSRMEVERTKRKPAPNALAKVFGETFFFPLVNRYQQEIAAYSSASVYSSVPFLLVTFLKTLALLLNASGPSTAGLAEISAEFWELLLSLRVAATSDISVLQAVLFSLLTLLEVNGDKRRIAQEHPKQLTETQQWVDMVFERTSAAANRDEKSDEAKVQTLAAGVLVKTREVIEAYQKELIGFTIE